MRLKRLAGMLPALVLLLFSSFAGSAQVREVTGKVVNQETGTPMQNVSVSIKGGKSVLTDEGGNFKISVPSPESFLVFTHIGYSTQEQKVGTRKSVDVFMTVAEKSMEDVVIIGYGIQKRRDRSTGAIASITGRELEDIPAPNIAGALRGRIAGVGVNSESGRPGASISLRIRDAATGGSGASQSGATADPLYVIDNMIVGKSTFDNLDPSMVDEIFFLKDASAAMYGAAGAKGVVVVTTKTGKPGPPKLSYNGYAGVSDATRKPEMLSAYDQALAVNEALRMNNESYSKMFSQEDLDYLKNVNYKSWLDEMWQPALTQRHNMSLSGGREGITYFIGGSYQNENANYAGQKQDKYSLRSGMNTKLLKGLSAQVNFNLDSRLKFSTNGNSANDQKFLEKLIQVPRWVPYSLDGKWISYDNSSDHPMGQMQSGFYAKDLDRSYGINASLVYSPESGIFKGLTARFQMAQTGGIGRSDEYRPNYQVYTLERMGNNLELYSTEFTDNPPKNALSGNNSRLIYGMDESSNYRMFGTLSYNRSFGKHDVNIVVGGEQTESKNSGLGGQWQDQNVPDFDYPWAFLTKVPTSSSLNRATKRSFFTNYSYNFDGKYTLEGTTRFDASSNFAANHIWGAFPSVGVAWVVSRENFFKDNVNFINYLKLRFSYGLTGEDRINKRLWQERYKVNAISYTFSNNTPMPGMRPQAVPNPDIQWEKKRSANLGVELSVLNNRLNLGFELYQNYNYDTYDKGANENYPAYAGFVAPIVNYQNRYGWGTEYSISYNQRFGRDVNFKAGINFGFSNTVIDRMFYNANDLWMRYGEDWIQVGLDPRKYNGSNYGLTALGMFRSQAEVDAFLAKNPNYTVDGVSPQAGWLYYKDLDGDGVITDTDKGPMYKTTEPALATGIQLAMNYKSFNLSVNIAADFGGKVFYDSKARRSIPTAKKNVPTFWKDRWTPENPDAQFPRADDPSINWESTFWAVDGTMIRVNDMTASYVIPKRIMNMVGLSSGSILLTGNNLWVLKNPLKYKDPYSSYIYDYPTMRTISVGLRLSL